MKFSVHPWKRTSEIDNLRTININEVVEIEVPVGKYFAKAHESIVYNEYDGAYSFHDDDFTVEGMHERYPLAAECSKHHGSYKGGTQTSAWFLVVADQPFRVNQIFMEQDAETWGTDKATCGQYYTDSELVTK